MNVFKVTIKIVLIEQLFTKDFCMATDIKYVTEDRTKK